MVKFLFGNSQVRYPLRESRTIIVWDEAQMVNRRALESLDKTFKDTSLGFFVIEKFSNLKL